MSNIKKYIVRYKKELVAFLIFILCIGIFSFSYAFAAVNPIRSITMTSRNTNYEDKEEGSWQVEKSAYWTKQGEAEIKFKVNTNVKHKNNYTDFIFVLDISGSMEGEKIQVTKDNTKELINTLFQDNNNKVALITFNDTANTILDFTNNKTEVINAIDQIEVGGETNYYQALLNVETILQGYQKQDNRDTIVLFLTDGLPTKDTPNEVGEYNLIKQNYPYVEISGVQYEMGDVIMSSIKKISDKQYTADRNDLDNVLFDASGITEGYDTFEIIDYINPEYFEIENEKQITVDQGNVELTDEDGKQKVIWNLNGLKSGTEVELTMKVKLKNDFIGTGGLYPTNESTEVISKIDDQNENESITNTPILSEKYSVTYDGNAPDGCTVTNVPGSLEHLVFDTIEISDTVPVCEGYQFKGWKIATKDVTKINNNYFTMPESDVEIKAEWSKISTTKTMDGEIYVAPTLYNFMKQEAVMDNTKSEFVSSSTGIHFGRAPSNTNGKGVYIRFGTENDEYPIMYYRGDVDNNHVKFGGFCWKIVRTTETGGTKLIYDGVPDSNGYCNNTGTASQIGTSRFNQNNHSVSDVGYMVGALYTSSLADVAWHDLVNKSSYYTSMANTNYYYANSVTYSNGTYTLVYPTQYSWSDNYYNLDGKYTCMSDNATSCSVVYYVNDASSSYMYRVRMTNGETYDSLYQEASEPTWIYGNDVTWNGNSYTLVDTVESKPINWDTDRTSIVGNGHRYTCMSNSDICTAVYYIYETRFPFDFYYMTLNNGVNIEGALNEMFPEDSNLRNQTDSTIKSYIDTWYSNNMTEYTKYLEDTAWCNDRSIYELNSLDKDYTGTNSLYFGPYRKNGISPYIPDLSCPSLADSFTVSSENGNGKLTYPVALLTADETTLGGSGYRGYSSNSYLNTGQSWWTLSPSSFSQYYSYTYEVTSSGNLNYSNNDYNSNGVRPSIVLTHDLIVARGDGTSENPYELVLE